jgi:hypothetical protein
MRPWSLLLRTRERRSDRTAEKRYGDGSVQSVGDGDEESKGAWVESAPRSVTYDLGQEGEEMIDEEYRGYNLTAVRRSGMWEVSIYPLSVGQIVPRPQGRQTAQAVAREDAFIEARRRVDALLAFRTTSAGSS